MALAAIPVVATMGIAVDAARMYMVQTRLKTAIDAAALSAARDINIDPATRDKNANDLFWANFERSAPDSTLGFLGTTIAGGKIQVTPVSDNVVAVKADGLMPTTFMNIFGIRNVAVTSSNQATRAATGMELALVLDNTGSMKGWPIQSVKTAATKLVNIVYGNGTQDTQPNLWVSVVPFSAEVNIGNSHTAWLKNYNPSDFAGTIWKGCVMARYDTPATGLTNDFTDVPPGQVLFSPFLYPSTHTDAYKKIQNGKTVYFGDNDWTSTKITEDQQSTRPDNTAVGPNLGCPQGKDPNTGAIAPLPILPLTEKRSVVLGVIRQMVANFRGGTFINLGLQAGWWTLSPRWRGNAGWGDPKLPLDYNTLFMKKVIVLMTDGNNVWYDWPGGAPGACYDPSHKPIDTTNNACPVVNWNNNPNEDDGNTDFTAYGRLKDDNMHLGSANTKPKATDNINKNMKQMCQNIKAQGIIIYAILFNHDGSVTQSTQDLFQACATDPQHYFVDVTDAQLQATFSTIGGQLASLRLSQ